jgi:hypothetical protein
MRMEKYRYKNNYDFIMIETSNYMIDKNFVYNLRFLCFVQVDLILSWINRVLQGHRLL